MIDDRAARRVQRGVLERLVVVVLPLERRRIRRANTRRRSARQATTAGRRMAYYANRKFARDVAEMPTRNVVLTEYQAELVERLVSSGRYQNASEVLREGLRLVENQEEEAKARLKALREAAREGIADVEAGRYRTFESPTKLRDHLGTLRDDVLSRKRKRSGG